MNKVKIIIDWVPNNYGAAPANEDIACVSTGSTLEDIKKNIVIAAVFLIHVIPVSTRLKGECSYIYLIHATMIIRVHKLLLVQVARIKNISANHLAF